MASFTNQRQRMANEHDLKARWNGGKPGEKFRCYLCGHKIKYGELWRWVYGRGKTINFMVCNKCDGPNLFDRWLEHHDYCKNSMWWALD